MAMSGLLDWLAATLHLTPNTVLVLAAVLILLGIATLVGSYMARSAANAGETELELRLRSWWWIVLLVAGALAFGRMPALAFFAIVSFLALKEFLTIVPTRRADRVALFMAYLAVPIQTWLIATEHYGIFIIFVPVYMFLLLPSVMVVRGETQGFLKAAGTLHWGLMTTVYTLGHVAYLLMLPHGQQGIAEGAALVVALLVLTEANDVAQYVWGKTLGRHAIMPKVSPRKTWEGFLGGLVTTALLAVVLLPLLTPHGGWLALGCGVLIAVAGFFGDVTVSAVKRDIGRKDSGTMIPGHGGILDRVDSLIFTAPLFFHVTRWFHYAGSIPA